MDYLEVNKNLLALLLKWEENSKFMELAAKHNLSRPYVCNVIEEYVHAEKRMMIVGQETLDFPLFDYAWSEEEIQQWSQQYLKKQLWNKAEIDAEYNKSAFWRFFRDVNRTGYIPCWNNVNKAHMIIDGKTVGLYDSIVDELSYKEEGKTILQQEIECAEPKVIVFITGPYYIHSMAYMMDVNEEELRIVRPTPQQPLSDITEVVRSSVPVFWTYHPTYLNQSRLYSTVIEKLELKLK